MARLTKTLLQLLRSKRFFWAVIIFFVCESLWFVFSAVYPMAFDEDFHLGVIRIYAQQWSPILTHQPDGLAPYGALTTDPSYLYHYLMSFPYRFIALFTGNQTVQVVCMRLLNVGMAAAALVVFARVLHKAKISRPLTNVILAVFALIPIAPMLAAHINYDNLLFLLLALLCLLVFRVAEGLQKRQLFALPFSLLAIVSMVICLVKYAALPLVFGTVLYLLFVLWRSFRGHASTLWPAVKRGFGALSRKQAILLATLFVVVSVLFVQRYGSNLYRYHTPVPECDAVISVERCTAYGPFARNHRMYLENPQDFNSNPLYYTDTWVSGMWQRLFFVVNGPASKFATRMPLPVPSAAALVVCMAGVLLFIWYARRIFYERPFLVFFMILFVVYAAVLWWDNYTTFLYTRQPVAINGRYFIPLVPMMAAIIGSAYGALLGTRTALKVWLATIVIVLCLYGGGVMTFMLRSDHSWYWNNPIVYSANDTVRGVLSPVIVEGKPY